MIGLQRFVNNAKLRLGKRSNQYALLCAICFFQALIFTELDFECPSSWQTTELTFNYSYGFIRRGLLGTIVSGAAELFHISDVEAFISIFQFSFMLIFTVMLIWFFMYCQKNITGQISHKAFFWIVMFFTLCGAGTYYFAWGEPDTVMISITLLICFLIIKDKALWLIAPLCAVCEMIHEGYILMFFSLPMALLIYRILLGKGNRKKLIAALFASGLLTSALFIYFYFFSGVSAETSLSEFIANSYAMIGEKVETNNIRYIFFNGDGPDEAMWLSGKPTRYFLRRIICFALLPITLFPVVKFVFGFFCGLLKASQSINEKAAYAICSMGALSTVPLFVVHTDTGRWLWDVVFYYAAIITVMLAMGDKKAKLVFDKAMSYKPLTIVCVLIYLMIVSFIFDEEYGNKICSLVAESLVSTAK